MLCLRHDSELVIRKRNRHRDSACGCLRGSWAGNRMNKKLRRLLTLGLSPSPPSLFPLLADVATLSHFNEHQKKKKKQQQQQEKQGSLALSFKSQPRTQWQSHNICATYAAAATFAFASHVNEQQNSRQMETERGDTGWGVCCSHQSMYMGKKQPKLNWTELNWKSACEKAETKSDKRSLNGAHGDNWRIWLVNFHKSASSDVDKIVIHLYESTNRLEIIRNQLKRREIKK